ncbi:MAG TPA: hypothetical protein VF609_00330 [Flavisolibacter sp.]|jgi:hypothetical protein
MTFSKFCSATQFVQKTVITFHGVLLMERRAGNLNAMLYQVDDFYVEVFFKDNSSSIFLLKCYADTSGIEAYLHLIDIGDVKELL